MMPAENKMTRDQNFQQRWGLREKNDILDSSDDESKSSSRDINLLKENRLVTDLELPENDDITDPPLNHLDPQKGNSPSKSDKIKKTIKKKTKKPPTRKGERKKKVHSTFKNVYSFDDFEVFRKSVIDKLRVAREEMFSTMREEIDNSYSIKKAAKTRKKIGQEEGKNEVQSSKNARKKTTRTSKKPIKSDGVTDSIKSREETEDQVSPPKIIKRVSTNKKKKEETPKIPIKEPIYPSNIPDKGASSTFFSIPTVFSEPRSQNFIPNSERAKSQIDDYVSRMQNPEHFGSVPQMGFGNMGCLNQQRTQTSSTGFLATNFHPGSRNVFNIQGQGFENLSRGNNMSGMWNDGGAMRFSGGNNAFLGNFVTNKNFGDKSSG